MKEILVHVKCIACEKVSYVKSEQFISATIEPDIRDAIVNERYFQCICTCGKTYPYFHPCLYFDQKHVFLIYGCVDETKLSVTKLAQFYPHIQKRYVVNSPQMMKEFIIILEEGNKPETIFKIKETLKQKKPQYHPFYYDGMDEGCYWFYSLDQGKHKKYFGISISKKSCSS